MSEFTVVVISEVNEVSAVSQETIVEVNPSEVTTIEVLEENKSITVEKKVQELEIIQSPPIVIEIYEKIATSGSDCCDDVVPIPTDDAAQDVSALKALYVELNGVAHADSNIDYEKSSVIGISITSNTQGNKVKYRDSGRLQDPSLNFPVNTSLYLGTNGNITDIPAVVGFRTKVGVSLGIGAMIIAIQEPIIL